MIVLRKPNRKDYKNIIGIISLRNEMYHSIFTEEEYQDRGYGTEIIDDLIEGEKTRTYVGAYEEEEIVGYASYRLKNMQTVRLSMIYTHPKYQNKGIGSLLLKHVENFAKTNKALVVVLETEKKAYRTKRFYEKNGYEILSDNDLKVFPYDKILEKKQVECRYIFGKKV